MTERKIAMSEKKGKRDWSKVQRNSSKQISFRATEAEAELVTILASESDLSVAEYVRTRATSGTIKRPAMRREDSQKVVQSLFAIENELARQGNNLNQIARKLNSEKQTLFFTSDERKETTECLKAASEAHRELLESIQSIWKAMS